MGKIITLQLEVLDNGEVKILSQTQEAKAKKEKKAKPQQLADVVVRSGSVLLSDKLIEAIGANEGDKVDIKYEIKDNRPIPIIATSSTWNDEEGNKLTKAKSVRLGKDDSITLNAIAQELMISEVIGKRCYLKVYTPADPVEIQETKKSKFSI